MGIFATKPPKSRSSESLRIATIDGVATEPLAEGHGADQAAAAPHETAQRSARKRLPLFLILTCQLARVGLAAWVIWMFAVYTSAWANKATIMHFYSGVAGHALEPISRLQQAAGYSTTLITSIVNAVLAVKNWQMFSHYIAGRIFDREAVSAFRTMTHMAVAALLVEFVMRFAACAIVSRSFTFFFDAGDPLRCAFVLGILTQAEILSAGKAIAEEHSQII
ncbi:MAG: hypothetical protein FWD68_14180 [Alphaproteobacteria bacterium]|nr:hypothetical protein [Alphaproteobacteria bacterium]